MGRYLGRLRAGVVNCRPNITVSRTSPCLERYWKAIKELRSSCRVFGDDGMGFVVATRATQEACPT